MTQTRSMPGAVGSQGRAQSGGSPTSPSHYTHFSADVNSDPSWYAPHAFDWATRNLRDAERAAAMGNGVAEMDLLNLAMQGLSLAEPCHREDMQWT